MKSKILKQFLHYALYPGFAVIIVILLIAESFETVWPLYILGLCLIGASLVYRSKKKLEFEKK